MVFLGLAACGGSTTAPTGAPSPVDPPGSAPDCGRGGDPDAAMTPDQCQCLGGQVRGDIGDGQIQCADGERELGRVATGIEGGVCCMTPTSASR